MPVTFSPATSKQTQRVMISKFIFLRNVNNIDVSSVIYIVMVPDSESGRKQVALLTSYAAAHGIWFEKWAEHVDFRIDYYQERVFWNAPGHLWQFRSIVISSARLVRLCKSGDFASFEQNVSMPGQFFKFITSFFPGHHLSVCRQAHVPHLLTPSRKNLSVRRGSEVTDAVVGFSIVAILYVVQMILDAVERMVCF